MRPATVVVVYNTPVPITLPTGWEGSYFSYLLNLDLLYLLDMILLDLTYCDSIRGECLN